MDYNEEQTNELEALQSIYANELTVMSAEPPRCFQITLTSQPIKDCDDTANCTIQFRYTDKYPDEVPLMEITDSENLDDDCLADVLTLMNQQAEENLGMVMVFTIVSAVQEKLTELVETKEQRRIDEQERIIREKEEAEQKRFEGTRVTVETFLAWKAKFDAEIYASKRQKCKEEVGVRKLTGKELFMQDHTLDDSDINFLEDGGEVVEVDESLFEDIGDLTLEDDDSELADSFTADD